MCLLGIAIGVSFLQLKRRIMVVVFSSICLLSGIIVILYIFHFPVLGSGVGTNMDSKVITIIFILSFLYCWIFGDLCRMLVNKLRWAFHNG